MRSDINLLVKRKTKQFSSKSFAIVMIGILFIVGALYAGIALPSQALSAVKLSVTALDTDIQASSHIELELIEKTTLNRDLSDQLSSLETLENTKSDIYSYLETIEKSLPVEANLTQLNFEDNEMYIIGIASSDSVVATLCLRLRESGMFDSVYITNSTAMSEEQTSFSLSAILPFSLNSDDLTENMLGAASDTAAKEGE